MKYYIERASMIDQVFSDKQTFFCQIVDGLDEDVSKALIKFEEDKRKVRRYLQAIVGTLANPHEDINTLEVPECLQEIVSAEGSRKKKATAPTSSSKSQTKRKKIQSKSSTNRKKVKSNG